MNRASSEFGLEQMHVTLAKDWAQNEDRIKTTWTHFTDEERSMCYHSTLMFQARMASIPIYTDPAINPALAPEWCKIPKSDAQYLLDMLELRATRSLYQQSFCSFRGFESDYSHAVQMISKGQVNLGEQPPNSRRLFVGDRLDGAVVDIATHTSRLREFSQHGHHTVGVRALPEVVGELVIWRQLTFLRNMVYLVCEILGGDRKSSQGSKRACTRFEELMNASIRRSALPSGVEQSKRTKILLPGLISRALSFLFAAEEAKSLLESCPIHFFDSIARFLRSAPGQARGNKRQVTATAVGAAFFDCISDKTKILCLWNYIIELLCLLHSTFDEAACRHMVLQQLSNATRLAYAHLHALFRRELHIHIAKIAVKKVKGSQKNHPARGSRLQHLCSLAEQHAFADISSEIFTKLMSSPPSFHDGINWQDEALDMLTTLIIFIDEVAEALNMPSFPWPANGEFMSQFEHVDVRMSQARPHTDIRKLWLKMSISKNIAFVKSCHAKLDACTRKHTGDTLLGAYEAVVNSCLLALKSQLSKEKQNAQAHAPVESPSLSEVQVEAHQAVLKIEAKDEVISSAAAIETRPVLASFSEDNSKDGMVSDFFSAEETKDEQEGKPVTVDTQETAISVSISEVEDEVDLAEACTESKAPVTFDGELNEETDLAEACPESTEKAPASVDIGLNGETDSVEACPKTTPKALVPFDIELEEDAETAEGSTETTSILKPVLEEEEEVGEGVRVASFKTDDTSKPFTPDSAAQDSSLSKAKAEPRGQRECCAPSTEEELPRTPRAVQANILPIKKRIAVSPATAQVFATLFDRSLSRAGLNWAGFEAAMAELDFRITPRGGSSVRFEPPASLGLQRSLTIHRPHGCRSEGFRALILRQRLNRAFGWDEDTFVSR